MIPDMHPFELVYLAAFKGKKILVVNSSLRMSDAVFQRMAKISSTTGSAEGSFRQGSLRFAESAGEIKFMTRAEQLRGEVADIVVLYSTASAEIFQLARQAGLSVEGAEVVLLRF